MQVLGLEGQEKLSWMQLSYKDNFLHPGKEVSSGKGRSWILSF
jgi:hypothetical protein